MTAIKTKPKKIKEKPVRAKEKPSAMRCPECDAPMSFFLGGQVCFPCRNLAVRKAQESIPEEVGVSQQVGLLKLKKPRHSESSDGDGSEEKKKPAGWNFGRLVALCDAVAADHRTPFVIPEAVRDEAILILRKVSDNRKDGAASEMKLVSGDDLRELGLAVAAAEGIGWGKILRRPLAWVAERLPEKWKS